MRVRQPAARPLPPSSLHDKAIRSSASVLPPYSHALWMKVCSPPGVRAEGRGDARR